MCLVFSGGVGVWKFTGFSLEWLGIAGAVSEHLSQKEDKFADF